MPRVDFSSIFYFPCLQSSPEERLAYTHLSEEVKDRILPIFELSIVRRPDSWRLSEPELNAICPNRNFILDLCQEPAPQPFVPRAPTPDDERRIDTERRYNHNYNNFIDTLLAPRDGFSNWRNLVARFPNAIPTIIYNDPRTQERQIVRQAALLAQNSQSIAIRIRETFADEMCSIVPQIINILGSASQLMIILDAGYGRQNVQRRSQFIANSIGRITAGLDVGELAEVQATTMSSSFSRPTQDGTNEMLGRDWQIWRVARQVFTFKFGDFGSMFRIYPPNTFRSPEWTATVNLPQDESWINYKHPNNNDRQGWVDGSIDITPRPEFAVSPMCWGKTQVTRAATGDLAGIDRASIWRAIRINMHITRQVDSAENVIDNYVPDPDA